MDKDNIINYPCTDIYIIPNDTNKFVKHNLEIKVNGVESIGITTTHSLPPQRQK